MGNEKSRGWGGFAAIARGILLPRPRRRRARPSRARSGAPRSTGPSAPKGNLAGQRSLTRSFRLAAVGSDAIGALGVSGAQGGQQADEACAKAGIAKVMDQLK
jgi:hypothetical protein